MKFYIDVEHAGLGKFERVQGTDSYVVQQRAAAKRQAWEQQWERRCKADSQKRAREAERERRSRDKDEKRQYLESRKAEAEEATGAAERAVTEVETILEHTLGVDDRIDFDRLKDRSTFSDREPTAPELTSPPPEPTLAVCEHEAPVPSFWVAFLEVFSANAKRLRLEREAAEAERARAAVEAENESRMVAWRRRCADIERQNASRMDQHRRSKEDWARRRRAFWARQDATNRSIDGLKQRYLAREADAVEQYCDLVLSGSKYPETFPQTFEIQYRSEAKLLLVEYVLPVPEHMPKTKAVRYVQARDELVESELSEAAQRKLYDSAVYQIALRTLHELFEADAVDALQVVAFNGVVETIDPATGQRVRPCIISVQTGKAEFAQLNLAGVEPKACFRKLRGVGSAQLHALVPVPPVLRFQREDVRFVEGRAVLEEVSQGQNLACMPWEDFEHLIRDLFEREFTSPGAEVRITRASRDGGVDAVIFDPDPIRGGKIVVQAKRYTNTVGVAAVRDLYGAVTAERAAKGILVTTAAFGPDSYEFAKDKPIALLDGGGLLHLLQRHGVPASIDLQQAKRMAAN